MRIYVQNPDEAGAIAEVNSSFEATTVRALVISHCLWRPSLSLLAIPEAYRVYVKNAYPLLALTR